MKIFNILALSSAMLISACQKQSHTDVDQQKVEQKGTIFDVSAEKTASETEFEIPATIENKNIQLEPNKYPKEVIQAVDGYREDCEQTDKISDYSQYIKKVNLRGLGVADYMYYPSEIICGSVAAMYGNGGTEVYIYSTLNNKQTKETFGNRLFDSKIVENEDKQELHLLLGGGYCDQDMEKITKAEAVSCWRVVEWDDKKQEFVLGKMYIDDKQ